MLFVLAFLSLSTWLFDREKNSNAIESLSICFSIRKGPLPLMAGFSWSVVVILIDSFRSFGLCMLSKVNYMLASVSLMLGWVDCLFLLYSVFEREIIEQMLLSGLRNKKYSFSRMRVRASLKHFLRVLRTYLSSAFSGPERMKEQPSLAWQPSRHIRLVV